MPARTSTDPVGPPSDARALEDRRYPVGRFVVPSTRSAGDRPVWLDEIAAMPGRLRAAVNGLTETQLETPYRDGGWTVRQVVHHLADSHVNSYTRFRLACTEENPTIRPYDEASWAELADAAAAPLELSLTLLEGLHARWVLLMRSFGEEDWARTFRHPEHDRTFTLHGMLAMYAWHCRHHLAHIQQLRAREGW